jgi:tRNA threonylcarbamoyladenosine dehydratase
MASFFQDTLNNPRFQLFATAVLSGATVASLLLGYQALEREERVYELKSSIPSPSDDPELKRVRY